MNYAKLPKIFSFQNIIPHDLLTKNWIESGHVDDAFKFLPDEGMFMNLNALVEEIGQKFNFLNKRMIHFIIN